MIDCPAPGSGSNLSLSHLKELVAVQEPGDPPVGWIPPIHDHAVDVEARQATPAGLHPAGNTGVLVTRPEGSVGVARGQVAAVEGGGVVAQPVDIFHDVDLAVLRPFSRS